MLTNTAPQRPRKISYWKYSEEGKQKFGKLLLEIDWIETFVHEDEDPTRLDEIMNTKLNDLMAAFFERKTRTIKAQDLPWITPQIKQQMKKRDHGYIVNMVG